MLLLSVTSAGVRLGDALLVLEVLGEKAEDALPPAPPLLAELKALAAPLTLENELGLTLAVVLPEAELEMDMVAPGVTDTVLVALPPPPPAQLLLLALLLTRALP